VARKNSYHARATISVNAKPRVLFSVRENSLGELTVVPKVGNGYRESNVNLVTTDYAHQHFTVHASVDSSSAINVIKRTVNLLHGHPKAVFQHTSAIKQDNGFALLFTRRSGNLSHAYFEAKPSEREVRLDLGSYDPTRETLYFAVFVGETGRQFSPTERCGCNVVQHAFSRFHLVLVSCFQYRPSDDSGDLTSPITTPAEESGSEDTEVTRGLCDDLAMSAFHHQRDWLKRVSERRIREGGPTMIWRFIESGL
jgi:hypothetical protein